MNSPELLNSASNFADAVGQLQVALTGTGDGSVLSVFIHGFSTTVALILGLF